MPVAPVATVAVSIFDVKRAGCDVAGSLLPA